MRMEVKLFTNRPPIKKLCQNAGDIYRSLIGNQHQIDSYVPGRNRTIHIAIRDEPHGNFMAVTAQLPITFPIDKTPNGLFLRAMMRSRDLRHASWCVLVADGCNVVLWMNAEYPSEWFNQNAYNAICREITGEIEAFYREICDRFRYGPSMGGPDIVGPGSEEIMFIDETGQSLPFKRRWGLPSN